MKSNFFLSGIKYIESPLIGAYRKNFYYFGIGICM